MLLKPGTHIALSFVPKVWEDDNYQHVKYDEQSKYLLERFLKSSWFAERAFEIPFYTPEMYYLDEMVFVVENQNGNAVIFLKGEVKRHDPEYVMDEYNRWSFPNKTWSDEPNELLTFDYFIDHIESAFYNIACEGEINILGLGTLSFHNLKFELGG